MSIGRYPGREGEGDPERMLEDLCWSNKALCLHMAVELIDSPKGLGDMHAQRVVHIGQRTVSVKTSDRPCKETRCINDSQLVHQWTRGHTERRYGVGHNN